MRREDRNSRVIGTLLGRVTEDVIEVTECFGVPHTEKTDTAFVAIDQDYHKAMYNFHKRINRSETIIGWFATTSPDGVAIIENSVFFHEFYSGECGQAVHLVVDTSLTGDALGVRAFVHSPMYVSGHSVANLFHELKVELVLKSGSDLTALYHMIYSQQDAFSSPTTLASIPSQTDTLNNAIVALISLIEKVQLYVQEVLEEKRPADATVGRQLSDIVGSLQILRPVELQKIYAAKSPDILMTKFLVSLTKTQLTVAERLLQVL